MLGGLELLEPQGLFLKIARLITFNWLNLWTALQSFVHCDKISFVGVLSRFIKRTEVEFDSPTIQKREESRQTQ